MVNFLKKTSRQRKYKCTICGKRLTRSDLVISRGMLVPFYNILNARGELKPICVKCYHEIIGKMIARQARKELYSKTRAALSTHE